MQYERECVKNRAEEMKKSIRYQYENVNKRLLEIYKEQISEIDNVMNKELDQFDKELKDFIRLLSSSHSSDLVEQCKELILSTTESGFNFEQVNLRRIEEQISGPLQ